MTEQIHTALEKALTASIANMEQIPGRTLIAVDVSGSMSSTISAKSEVRCCDIASLMGAMASRVCKDATVCYFDYTGSWSINGKDGYRIAQHSKDESVLNIALQNSFSGGGTDMSLPMRYALEQDQKTRAKRQAHPFDRVIYFSDNMCNHSFDGKNLPVQSMVDQYRAKYNKNFWVHGIDLQGYGTQQFCGSKFNLIAGWSDAVLPFIMLAERGITTLVDTIAAYEI